MGKKRKTYKDQIVFAATIFILLSGQIGKASGAEIFTFINFCLSAIIAMILPHEKLLLFVMAILPLNRLISIGSVTAPVCVMLIGVIRHIIKGKILRISRRFFVTFFMLIVYGILAMIWGESQVLPVIKMGVMLLFYVWEMQYIKRNDNDIYVDCVVYMSLGCVVSTALALLFAPESLRENVVRFTASINGSQNVLGILNAVCCLHCYYILTRFRGYNKVKLIFLTVGLLISGFMTGSRSYLLAVGVGFFSFILYDILSAKMSRIIKVCLSFVFLGLGAFILFNRSQLVHHVVASFLYRFNKYAHKDISNGRYALWKEYFTAFRNNPKYLWLGNMEYDEVGIHNVAHNMIIEQIASYGIIGSIIIVALYAYTAADIKYFAGCKSLKRSFAAFIPTIAFLAASMFSHTLLGATQTALLFIGYIAVLKNDSYTS